MILKNLIRQLIHVIYEKKLRLKNINMINELQNFQQ